AVLFASITLAWFERLIESFNLPPGWEASVISSSGHVLAHHPDAPPSGQRNVSAGLLASLSRLTATDTAVAELAGLDGAQRLYGISSPEFAPDSGFLAIGAPLERSMNAVEHRFRLHLALIAGIALLSALVARLYIYRLIEVW